MLADFDLSFNTTQPSSVNPAVMDASRRVSGERTAGPVGSTTRCDGCRNRGHIDVDVVDTLAAAA